MWYATKSDFIDRLQWIEYKRGRGSSDAIRLKPLTFIKYQTKRTHRIKGWLCVTEGETPLFDVWTGFNSKHFEQIEHAFVEACKTCNIEVKMS